jgi:hypothetical protein
MPRLLSTAEIIDIRERVHPDVHDDSCEVCSVFSTMSAMVSLIDIRADFDPDEPRDEDGKWTSSGGGGGAGGDTTNVYATPVAPTNVGTDYEPADRSPEIDDKVRAAVEDKAVAQAAIDNPTIKDFGHDPQSFNQYTAGAAKMMVASGIAAKMDSKYDTQLLGTNGGEQITTLLTADDMWMKDNEDHYNYAGKVSGFTDKWSVGLLANGEAILGNDPALLTNLREQSVSNLVAKWAGTSNDHSVESMAMQESAIKEFNLTGTTDWDDKKSASGYGTSYDFIDNAGVHHTFDDQVQSELDKNGDMYQAFLRAQYGNTQQFFKDNSITAVTAYRGFDFTDLGEFDEGNEDYPTWADSDNSDDVPEESNNFTWTDDVSLRPLSSFTYDRNSALVFAGDVLEGGSTGRVVSGVIPVARILSTAVTGNGCLGEREMVVLGGTDKWTIQ